MKLRFSLRALLLAITALAALGYWRTRPRYVAEEFASALQAGDFRRANALCRAGGEQERFIAGDAGAEFWAVRRPQSLGEWLRGECRVAFMGKGTAYGIDGAATVSARGIAAIRRDRSSKPSHPTPWEGRFQ